MDAFDQQIDLAGLAGGIGELLLHGIEVEEGQVLRRLGRRAEDLALGGALVETLESGGKDRLADRLAAGTAELPLAPGNRRRLTR